MTYVRDEVWVARFCLKSPPIRTVCWKTQTMRDDDEKKIIVLFINIVFMNGMVGMYIKVSLTLERLSNKQLLI